MPAVSLPWVGFPSPQINLLAAAVALLMVSMVNFCVERGSGVVSEKVQIEEVRKEVVLETKVLRSLLRRRIARGMTSCPDRELRKEQPPSSHKPLHYTQVSLETSQRGTKCSVSCLCNRSTTPATQLQRPTARLPRDTNAFPCPPVAYSRIRTLMCQEQSLVKLEAIQASR